MNYYKIKFIKNEKAQGKSYTYQCEFDCTIGDIVCLDNGSKGIVVDVAKKEDAEVFKDKIKNITQKLED